MSTIPVTPYSAPPRYGVPAATVVPLGPLSAHAALPAIPVMPAYPAMPTPVADASPAAPPVTATGVTLVGTVPAMLGKLRDLLGYLGNSLAPFLGVPPVPVTPPVPATPPQGGVTEPPGESTPQNPKQGATKFVVSSFNILGSNHTAPGGGTRGYAPGVTRIREAIAMLEQQRVDVVGFQEMQTDQAREFEKVAGETFGLFPGIAKGKTDPRNSVAWRKDTFKLVEAYTVPMPSHLGKLKPCPVVRLRDKKTGEEVYVVNVHNAPGFHKGGAQQNWRDKATAMQVELVNKLKQTGLPVILTGDMNDKEKVFRRMSQEAGLNAANELPNGQLPKQLGVDWIFGSDAVDFNGFKRLGEAVSRKISDHAMIVAQAKIPPTDR